MDSFYLARKTVTESNDILFSTCEELCEAAKDTSNGAPDEYQHSAYLYFIARYMVAIYEAQIGKLPIQVWNEYRNALDHFMRFITNPTSENGLQLSRMEGHLQRAVLDISKFLCYRMEEKLEDMIKREEMDCLRLVDNGAFIEEIQTGLVGAKNIFISAKTIDNNLGSDRDRNKEILNSYLKPCFNYLHIERVYDERRPDIEKCAHQLFNIKHSTENLVRKQESNKMHLPSHLLGHLIWAIITLVFAALAAKYKDDIIDLFPWLGNFFQ